MEWNEHDLNDEKMKRKKFTVEEDELLRELVKQHGEKSWIVIAKQLEGRTPLQVRDRWKNYLCPTIKNDPWTAQDDTMLFHYVMQFGPHWAQISKMMPGRTDVNLKNRWAQVRRCWNKGAPGIDLDASTVPFQSPYSTPAQQGMYTAVQTKPGIVLPCTPTANVITQPNPPCSDSNVSTENSSPDCRNEPINSQINTNQAEAIVEVKAQNASENQLINIFGDQSPIKSPTSYQISSPTEILNSTSENANFEVYESSYWTFI